MGESYKVPYADTVYFDSILFAAARDVFARMTTNEPNEVGHHIDSEKNLALEQGAPVVSTTQFYEGIKCLIAYNNAGM